MKPIDYKYWFEFDFWTFEQAAYLICNINPDDKNHIKHINLEKFKKINPNLFSSIDTYEKYFKLLNGTDFSKYGDKNAPTGSASVASIISFVKKCNIWRYPSHLKSEWDEISDKSTAVSIPPAVDTEPTDSVFIKFHEIEDLSYVEITITLLGGDLIELSARDVTISFTYESLKLRDMRKKDNPTLNAAGDFLIAFLSMATPKPKPDPKRSKHKDALKKLMSSWFGVKEDPFRIVGESPSTRYEAKFNIKADPNRAGKRIEKRAQHVSFNDQIATEYFDDEDDAAAEFLKENK